MHSSSVMRLINDWLQNEHVVLSEDLLTNIKDFVSRVTAGTYRPDGVVLHIVRGIQTKAYMHIGSTLGAWLMFELEGVNEPAASADRLIASFSSGQRSHTTGVSVCARATGSRQIPEHPAQ
jgi:hypothetical protein